MARRPVRFGSDASRARREAGERRRGSAQSRGYNALWRRERVLYLKQHPLCVQCKKPTAATVVDHVIPHRGDMELFWDRSNWQGLCKTHHDRKTARGA